MRSTDGGPKAANPIDVRPIPGGLAVLSSGSRFPIGPDQRGGERRGHGTHGSGYSSAGVEPGRTSQNLPPHPAIIADTRQAADTSSSSSTGARPRWDAPVVAHSKRGSREAALSAAKDPKSKDAAMRAILEDVSAKSVGGTLNSMLYTWELFHKQWFGNDVPVFPLTTEKIWAVASMFKQGKYKAYPNYCTVVKDHHMQRYGTWPKDLKRAINKTTRSVLRGLGPGRQSASLNLAAIRALNLGTSPLNPGGPINPGGMLECGGFWLPREIEASTARWIHATIDDVRQTATWRLPASKTDTAAIGCARSWGCVCNGDRSKPCGYHALKGQKELVARLFGKDDSVHDDVPLFPDADGNTCTKQSVVSTIEAIALRLGMPTVDEDGNRLFGGHSIRILAARHLASIGISLPVIMLLARGERSIIMRYVSETPLEAVTQDYKNLQCNSEITQYMKGLKSEILQNIDFTASSETELVKDLQGKCQELQKRLESIENDKGRYIVNTDPTSGKFHSLLLDSRTLPPSEWKTRCGWKYGYSQHAVVQALTNNWKKICGTCLPLERRALQPDDTIDSDVSSASSSSDSSHD